MGEREKEQHGREAFEAGHDLIPYWTYDQWIAGECDWAKKGQG